MYLLKSLYINVKPFFVHLFIIKSSRGCFLKYTICAYKNLYYLVWTILLLLLLLSSLLLPSSLRVQSMLFYPSLYLGEEFIRQYCRFWSNKQNLSLKFQGSIYQVKMFYLFNKIISMQPRSAFDPLAYLSIQLRVKLWSWDKLQICSHFEELCGVSPLLSKVLRHQGSLTAYCGTFLFCLSLFHPWEYLSVVTTWVYPSL